MKRVCLFLILSFSMTTYGQVSFGNPVKFDDGWKFQKGDDSKAASENFDDSRWRSLDLPHDWSVEGPLSPSLASANGYLPGGIAWYRKSFDYKDEFKGKMLYIYFEGIYRNGEVFINGKSVGLRPEGYISYMYDLTPYLKTGKNQLAVRVDHSKFNDSRWYTGSGIYRDVYLISANPVHIDQWGIYCTTPEVTGKMAVVKADVTVRNTTGKPESVTIVQELVSKDNKVVSKASGILLIQDAGTATLTKMLKVNNPMLWSLDSPNLYSLKTTIFKGNEKIDYAETTVGIRTISFDPNKGFSLNGKNMKMKGVCIHHDAGCLGSAVPAEVWRYRLENLKALGCNAIRTSHNPQAPALYDICDELGFLVMNEAFDEWEFPKRKWVEGWNVGTPTFDGHSEFFAEWGEKDLGDLVLRDRNHPSVIMWSIGNEVDYPNDPYSHPILDKEGIQQQHTAGYQPNQPNAERLGGIAKRLVAVVKKYDTSRPVTAGLAGPVMSNETEYPGTLDVAGYNYTENRYAMDHKTYPERILFGSENGHGFSAWKSVTNNDYIFGQFLWTGIDYLGESHRWPSRGFGSGLLDLAGFKKPRGWFRESLWSEKPMIYAGTYLKPRNARNLSTDALPLWNYNPGETVRVVCYTNCKQAQLLLNSLIVGETKNYDDETGIIYWDIPYQPGKLEVIGLNDNKECSRYAMETSKQPFAIKTKVINKDISVNKSLALIEIQIVDEDGKPVIMADNEITCTTDGPVKLLGLEASDITDMGNYSDNVQRAYQGKMIAYVQAKGEKGKAIVKFTSPWLKDAVDQLTIE